MSIHPINGRLLTENDVADLLNLSVRTLQQWRVSGVGPRFIKIGRAVRYRRPDIDAWVIHNSRTSTSDDAA